MQTARSITVTAAASLTAVLGLGVLTSCGTAAGQGDDDYTGPPVNGGTLRVAFDADITCADGQQAGNNTALNVSRQIADSLADQDPETGEIVPWLAESWDVSDDSTTFTFHLRDGVTFTDGTPFTAQSVKDNLEGIVDLGAKSSLGSTYLAAHFPGVNNTTVWADPDSGSHIEFAGFEHFARTAERGLFDFLFLAEGLRLREHKGQVFDQDVVGRPETATVLSALAAVTTHIGLTGTFNSTFNEPYDLARTLATLDRVSGGRAAWNVVTSHNAFTGANFRRGGYLDGADRYRRAADFVSLARTLWESHRGSDGSFDWHSDFFDVHGTFPVPETPQISPVIFQAGDSDEGRDFAARHAEVIFSAHTEAEDRKAFRTDIDQRLAAVGRRPDSLKIYPVSLSSSVTPRPRLRNGTGRSGTPRSTDPARSPSSSRCGAATSPATTLTAHCRTSGRTSTTPTSPVAASAMRRTTVRSPGAGGRWRRRRTSPSVSWSPRFPGAAAPSSAPRPRSPRSSMT